ncbi:MAG: hypothetical protein JKY42_11335 [Flavobacteriales bacterium]|nr:hypothetical protein [Flavobacteriales bacterium]
MKKLMLLFGLVAFIGTTNLSYAATSSNEVTVSVDCDKCKDHKCDENCEKDGCTAEKCEHAKEGATSTSKKSCTKKCTSKEGTVSAKKSCCKNGSAASCSKKKAEATPAEK